MTDDILKKCISDMCEMDLMQVERQMKEHPSIVPSKRLKRKMKPVLRNGFNNRSIKYDIKPHGHLKFRYVVLAAVLLIMTMSTVLVSSSLRGFLRSIAYTSFPDHIAIEKNTEEDLGPSSDTFDITKVPTYVPDGYKKENTVAMDEYLQITWANADGDILEYIMASPENSTINLTSDGSESKKVKIGNSDAILIKSGETNSLVYEKNGIEYIVAGKLEQEELIKMIVSIS